MWCEGPAKVDDVEVRLADGMRVLIQAKRTLAVERADGSEFAKVLRQFVAACTDGSPAVAKLVLAVGPDASRNIRATLPAVIKRIRDGGGNVTTKHVVTTAPEKESHETLLLHLRREWQRATGAEATNDELMEVIARMYVDVLDVESGGAQEERALDALKAMLCDSSNASLAWTELVERFGRATSTKSGAGPAAVSSWLHEAPETRLKDSAVGARPQIEVALVKPGMERASLKTDEFVLEVRNLGSVPLEFELSRVVDRLDHAALEPGTKNTKTLRPASPVTVHHAIKEQFTHAAVHLTTSYTLELWLSTAWPNQDCEWWLALVQLTSDNRHADTGVWTASLRCIYPSSQDDMLATLHG